MGLLQNFWCIHSLNARLHSPRILLQKMQGAAQEQLNKE